MRKKKFDKITPDDYLSVVPKAVPPYKLLIHNHVQPSRALWRGCFRLWLLDTRRHDVDSVEPCPCGFAPELGTHYRVKGVWDEIRRVGTRSDSWS